MLFLHSFHGSSTAGELQGILERLSAAILNGATSIPEELNQIVPYLPSVSVWPILHESQRENPMFEHWEPNTWMQPVHHYISSVALIDGIERWLLEPLRRREAGGTSRPP